MSCHWGEYTDSIIRAGGANTKQYKPIRKSWKKYSKLEKNSLVQLEDVWENVASLLQEWNTDFPPQFIIKYILQSWPSYVKYLSLKVQWWSLCNRFICDWKCQVTWDIMRKCFKMNVFSLQWFTSIGRYFSVWIIYERIEGLVHLLMSRMREMKRLHQTFVE